MAGLYIHIPFCQSRCIYCGFYSTTKLELRQRYVDAVCHEMELRTTSFSQKAEISTIYLGGGTPSQLTLPQLQQLFDSIYDIFHVSSEAEVTLEANPEDVTDNFATALKLLPVNRVSMGAQTFNENRLRFLARRHTAEQVPLAVKRLRDTGIRNISIDLMYGFPNETFDEWQHDIDQAIALDVEHLSAYCLTVEEGTKLFEQLKNGVINELDEELERQMYELLTDRLKAAGYEHYEISNFAKEADHTQYTNHPYRSLHNSSYWTDVPYIGIGAAAHSYDGHRRQWNSDNIFTYMEGIERKQPVVESEELDAATRYNDRIMLSLRTCEGIALSSLCSDDRDYLLSLADKYIIDGLLLLTADHLLLSRQGIFVSNMIISDLMRV